MATNLWRTVASCQEPSVRESAKMLVIPLGLSEFLTLAQPGTRMPFTVLYLHAYTCIILCTYMNSFVFGHVCIHVLCINVCIPGHVCDIYVCLLLCCIHMYI